MPAKIPVLLECVLYCREPVNMLLFELISLGCVVTSFLL